MLFVVCVPVVCPTSDPRLIDPVLPQTPGENLKVSSSRFSLDFCTMMKRVENTLVLIDCALPECAVSEEEAERVRGEECARI